MERALELADIIRQTSFEIHSYLRHGHFEKVYENALVHRLRRQALAIHPQKQIIVCDADGTPLGHYVADIVIEDLMIVEVKATKHILEEHIAQLFGYLRATGFRHGMLVNFGAARFEARKLIL